MTPLEQLKLIQTQIAQQYHTQRKAATRNGRPFNITHKDWLTVWQCHPQALSSGRMVRRDSSQPWSVANCVFVPGISHREASRTLTIDQWIAELRASNK